MARLCEGRVAIVTGGARGVGREHCLMLAEHGAKVVVNDLGGDRAGKGHDVGPAQQVVNEIKAKGGEAVANGDDVSDWNGAKHMIDQAVSAFGKLDAVVLNAGILRDRMLVNMTEDLRTYTDEDKETRSPKWIAPVSTWLVSEESREITGRVFQAGNGQFAVAEGWHKGPESKPALDPYQAGKILTELAKKARKNAGMNGLDLD